MAICRLIVPLLVLSVVTSYASTQVPVFLWGDLARPTTKSNPLLTLTASEFDHVLKDELQNDPFTVIFIEETLSVEDFSHKNSDGQSSFPYLHANIGDSLYLPSVEHALRVLNKLADPDKVDHVKLTENGLSAEIEPQSGNFLFINLRDAREGESRAELLRRHNDFMEKMCDKLQQRHDSVVSIYTAHYPSWTIAEKHSRVRRQVQVVDEYAFDNLLLYAKKIELQSGNNTVNLTELTSSSMSLNNTELNATLNFGDNSVTINFLSTTGWWKLSSVTLKTPHLADDLYSSVEVSAVNGFSYRCADRVRFTNFNNSMKHYITFEDLKVQPFFETMNSSSIKFGDSFNCVGFFSVPIWSGLLVVFILLAITFYGIMNMMDIRTMDRFDDPKGKTITINAAE